MIEETKRAVKSQQLALKLFDHWVRERRLRPDDLACSESKDVEALKEVGLKNFVSQLAEPRRKQLEELREVAPEMTTADKVALLVMTELPMLETASLLHRLATQVMQDPSAAYFSKINMASNCGSGCG